VGSVMQWLVLLSAGVGAGCVLLVGGAEALCDRWLEVCIIGV
jgi:hypothetical protein